MRRKGHFGGRCDLRNIGWRRGWLFVGAVLDLKGLYAAGHRRLILTLTDSVRRGRHRLQSRVHVFGVVSLTLAVLDDVLGRAFRLPVGVCGFHCGRSWSVLVDDGITFLRFGNASVRTGLRERFFVITKSDFQSDTVVDFRIGSYYRAIGGAGRRRVGFRRGRVIRFSARSVVLDNVGGERSKCRYRFLINDFLLTRVCSILLILDVEHLDRFFDRGGRKGRGRVRGTG